MSKGRRRIGSDDELSPEERGQLVDRAMDELVGDDRVADVESERFGEVWTSTVIKPSGDISSHTKGCHWDQAVEAFLRDVRDRANRHELTHKQAGEALSVLHGLVAGQEVDVTVGQRRYVLEDEKQRMRQRHAQGQRHSLLALSTA